MRKNLLIPVLLLPALLLAACEREREDPARSAAVRAAARDACIAEELAIEARERLAALEPMASTVPGPHTFARVFREYAETQAARFALADSAVRAPTPADSARYVQRAAAHTFSPAEAGTVEANVAAAYAREFRAIRANPAHYCNQEPL